MKKNLFFLFFLIILFFLPKNPYCDINHIHLIESISITCSHPDIVVELKEVIPKREDNSISYQYQTHVIIGKDLNSIKKEIIQSHFYIQGIYFIETNCSDISSIKRTFSISEDFIYS